MIPEDVQQQIKECVEIAYPLFVFNNWRYGNGEGHVPTKYEMQSILEWAYSALRLSQSTDREISAGSGRLYVTRIHDTELTDRYVFTVQTGSVFEQRTAAP